MLLPGFYHIYEYNAERKAKLLCRYITPSQSVLDFDCGDGSMISHLLKSRPTIQATGVDVVKFDNKNKKVSFAKISGNTIPFADRIFDVVIASNVFHHTTNPEHWLSECLRVSQKRVLMIEPVYRTVWERPFMNAWDWVCNMMKSFEIPMNYQYHTKEDWRKLYISRGARVIETRDIDVLPRWLPFGRITLFVVEKS